MFRLEVFINPLNFSSGGTHQQFHFRQLPYHSTSEFGLSCFSTSKFRSLSTTIKSVSFFKLSSRVIKEKHLLKDRSMSFHPQTPFYSAAPQPPELLTSARLIYGLYPEAGDPGPNGPVPGIRQFGAGIFQTQSRINSFQK
jgi:hypothetical protein